MNTSVSVFPLLTEILNFLEGLLDIVGYDKEDIKEEAQFLLEQIVTVATTTLVIISKDNAQKLNQLIQEQKMEEVYKLLAEEFNDQDLRHAFMAANHKVMENFFKDIGPRLTATQNQAVLEYLLQAANK